MTAVTLQADRQTAADLVDELAKCAAVSDVVKGHEADVRGRLEADVRATMETVGAQFTLRASAGTAYVSGGNPLYRVADVHAFGAWCEAVDASLVEHVQRVEVRDHEAAAQLLGMLDDQAGNRQDLRLLAEKALAVTFEWRIAKDAVAGLVERGLVAVAGDVAVDTETGEQVPGVEVGWTRETFTVRVGKKTREGYRAQLAGLLGLPGGGA